LDVVTEPHTLGALFTIDVEKARSDPKHAVLSAVAAECNPVRVALSPDESSLYVTARGSDHLLRFATASLGQPDVKIEGIKVGRSPVGVAVSGDGRQVWVSNSDRFEGKDSTGSLSLVGAEPGQPLSLILTRPAGGFPRDLRFLPDGKTLVSAEFSSSRIVLTAPVAP
jgi:DNA-binding beta-propeller fold protein YncE